MRHELDVTRTIEGGQPLTERMVSVVVNLIPGEVEPSKFVIPPEFQYAK